jgi:hypothetical protein
MCLADLVDQFNFQLFDHAALRHGDFHGSLVALHCDKALLGLDGVADLDYQFGDVANIRDLNFNECHFVTTQVPQSKSG